MTIKLKKDIEERLVVSIRRYVCENMDDEIGDLKARNFLDFCIKEIGSSIYNQAIADAQTHLANQIADLDGIFHETEFAYWRKQ